MKLKEISCAAALSLLGVGHAYAQSSVTLYGVVNSGVTYISNSGGHSVWKLDSGIDRPNVWGLTGREDLGSGLAALFKLESGFNLTNGNMTAAGKIFNRDAYVGLTSNQWGTVKMGQMFDYLYRNVTFYTNGVQFAPAYSFHLSYDIDRTAGEAVANAVDYETPNYRGLRAGVMYGFSNGNSNHVLSTGLSYAPQGLMGPFSGSLAYTRTNGSSSPTTDATIAQIVFHGDKVYTVAAGARLQVANNAYLNAVYSYTNLTLPLGSSMITQDFEIGGKYEFAPDLHAGVGYSYFMQRGVNVQGLTPTQKFGIASAGIDYLLSKRTSIYAFGTFQHAFAGNQPAGNFLVTGAPVFGPVAGTGIGPTGAAAGFSSGSNQAAVQIGIRQMF
ncbi:porin [Paraburkholderia youngii]|uniref:Porin n=1 Tax=Paraburkholderia youngii TaxID=2782701 RepID=A0A7W8L800_9BURK|nr:porin [Paraburkholderia youngii]MBB5402102.1 putative porin [Paraburkholderia youngii]NUX54047.1 porin [Paraburkholderia youngii]NVI02315.1 porin [Paraburkholderia youngii]